MSTRFSQSMEMTRLTRHGTTETVSRDQIIRRERGQGKVYFPCSAATTCRMGNLTRLIHTLVSLSMERNRLTRDGTAEPVSRDQILRHVRGQRNIHFSYSADHDKAGLATLPG